jgi:hypothetical protein
VVTSRVPGPLRSDSNQPVIDEGTLVRSATPPPGTLGIDTPAAAPVTAPVTDAEIEALDLAAIARAAAYALKAAHPTVSFTSGRRNKGDQARAMAGNVVKNRKWIEETYAASDLRTALQKWVDDNPKVTKSADVAAGLLGVFDAATEEAVGKFSKHLSGEAFDVQPVTLDAEAIKKTIRGLEGLGKFLETEGGLVRWHAQF